MLCRATTAPEMAEGGAGGAIFREVVEASIVGEALGAATLCYMVARWGNSRRNCVVNGA